MSVVDNENANEVADEAMSCERPLTYPLHSEDKYSARVKIIPYKINPPELSGGLVDLIYSKKLWNGEASAELEANPTSVRMYSEEPDIGRNIVLYLPVGLAVNDGFNIGPVELGPKGGAALGAIQNGGSIANAVKAAAANGVDGFVSLIKGSANQDLARTALVRGASKFGTDFGGAASIAGAVSVNPNTRAVFSGVNLREFTFQFKFLPRSLDESNEVAEIIKRLRECAYPETIQVAETGIAVGYKYPNLFDIKIQHVDDKGYKDIGTKIHRSFISRISTNYNPSNMAFFSSGHPVEIDLSITFVEQKTLDRQMIKEGY